MSGDRQHTRRLDVRWRRDDAGHRVWFAGSIGDGALLTERVTDAQRGRLIIDTKDVRFINSVGVREWIDMLRALAERGVSVVLRQLSEVMVHQLNMIIEAKGEATIDSFMAPYACDHCGREESMLIVVADHRAALRRMTAPPMTCPECGHIMAFFEFPERYFLFLL